MSNMPATGRREKNALTVATMASQSRTMLTSARRGDRSPKKTGVQVAFSPSWAVHRSNGVRDAEPPLPATSHAASPIRAYRTVHTGPKTQPGGAHDGFLKPA